ncbi:MAG: glycosyltransferase family 4 protein [Salinivenus sp.]
MHIGHFVRDLDGKGGIETYVSRLVDGLDGRGHPNTLFGLQGDASTAHRVRLPDISSLYAEARRRGVDVLHLHTTVSEPPPSTLPTIRTVHDNGAACPSGSRYLKRTGTPCPRVASLSGCLFGHYVDGCGSRRPHKVWENFERLLDNKRVLPGRPTVAVSQYVKEEMVTLGYPEENIQVVLSPAPSGPSTPPPLSADAPPHLLFLGRLVPEKGVDWLLRSVAALDEPVHLDIAGTGDHEAALVEQVGTLGLQDVVTFHGWTDGPALERLFRSARAVVVPSVWHEPAGLVPLEAAAWGRPVVASRVGGLPEYAHSSFSTLVPPNDVPALTDALRHLCTDLDAAARLGRAGHAHVRRHHTMARFLDQHEGLYASLHSSAPPPTP